MKNLPDFRGIRLLVAGDVMLDEALRGDVNRISPEAPVPVVLAKTREERPGGAANVAMNLVALGAEVTLLGQVGQDEAADRLTKILNERGIKTRFFKTAPKTIRKLRILSHHHQMIRVDEEDNLAFHDELDRQAFIQAYEAELKTQDLVILSDYGKGTLSGLHQNLISLAKQKGLPVLVDPKSLQGSIYRGASVLTPNLKEFETWVGPCPSLNILEQGAHQLLADWDLDALVITRSEKGMSVIQKDQVLHVSAQAREVHDVTGAGDTVIALIGLGLASKLPLAEAVNLANLAAGIVVGKAGTASVSREELQQALEPKLSDLPLGVFTPAELLDMLRVAKAQGEKIVFTNGCFDILHAGHVQYLNEAKALGSRLIVAVNTDDSITKLKGPERPMNPLADRMTMLAALKAVDWVVPFAEDTPEALIQSIKPDVLVKGGDYQDIHALPGARFVLSQGAEVRLLSLRPDCSTTQLIEKIREKELV